MPTLKAAPNSAILLPGHKVLKGGDELPEGALTPAQIEGHLKSGYLVASRGPALSVAEVMATLPAGVPVHGGLSPNGTPLSRWALNPEGLEDKDLDSLNVMVIERDSQIEPFEDRDEAVAWLSQDYTEDQDAE